MGLATAAETSWCVVSFTNERDTRASRTHNRLNRTTGNHENCGYMLFLCCHNKDDVIMCPQLNLICTGISIHAKCRFYIQVFIADDALLLANPYPSCSSCFGARDCHWCDAERKCVHYAECCTPDDNCCDGISNRNTTRPRCQFSACVRGVFVYHLGSQQHWSTQICSGVQYILVECGVSLT